MTLLHHPRPGDPADYGVDVVALVPVDVCPGCRCDAHGGRCPECGEACDDA